MRKMLRIQAGLLGIWCIGVLSGCSSITTPTKNTIWLDNPKALEDARKEAQQKCQEARRDVPAHLPDNEFTTDGCSMWPDGSWRKCCVIHDMPYWCGGSAEDRNDADHRLSECVAKESSWPWLGSLMYAGVRFGGMPWWPVPWRWGYGWDWPPHGYEQLQPQEKNK
jgi:hypothetical protein